MERKKAGNIAKARRRRDGRTSSEQLRILSANGQRLGKCAFKVYGTARLSVTKWTFSKLREVCRYYGMTISKAARLALEIAAQITNGETSKAAASLSTFEAKGKKAKPRRTTETKADIWAKSEGGRARACVNFRLNARNLFDIANRSEEDRANGGRGKTFSKAFNVILSLTLIRLQNQIDNKERIRKLRGTLEEPAKPKQRRNRKKKELKEILKAEGTKSGL